MFGTLETLDHSFKLKTMLNNTACECNCSCGENCVGESVRNAALRWAEHENSNKQLEPARHLKYFPDHQLESKVLTRAPEYTRKRKIFEAFLIKSINPYS